MSGGGLTTSGQFLTDAAEEYFNGLYENPSLRTSTQIDPSLGWTPSIHFKASNHLTIAAEVSETPYPAILRLRHADIANVQVPIAVYSVCPEEAYLEKKEQSNIRQLQQHGYGLLTVDGDGHVQRRFGCIPLIQHIPETEITGVIKEIPRPIKLRIRDAFQNYELNAGAGVSQLSEIVEALAISAAKGANTKGWLSVNLTLPVARILDEMFACPQLKSAAAAIGGARSYISVYRNAAHHPPRSKKAAYIKYRDCQHGFREGIRRILDFRDSMKKLGIQIRC